MPPTGGISRAWLRTAFSLDNKAIGTLPSLLPVFLCPVVQRTSTRALFTQSSQRYERQIRAPSGRRYFSGAAASAIEAVPESLGDISTATTTITDITSPVPKPFKELPAQCPGCGAYSQTSQPGQPGYFDLGRQSTRAYLGLAVEKVPRAREEDRVVREALRRMELENGCEDVRLSGLLHDREREQPEETDKGVSRVGKESILCVRCHDLVHHTSGAPIYHPGIDDIRETIAESPYKYNHVYHVLDAADFPMSLLPRINSLIGAIPLRTRNRRSIPGKFVRGRRTELSFVITRADLLAPRRDQVGRLMPWIRDTLRDALGRLGRNVRLGNVRCVSARRNWWTPELKEEIWDRGGANWLVGKANVGKSYLVHHVFPKGRMDMGAVDTLDTRKPLLTLNKKSSGHYGLRQDTDKGHDGYLLPPRPEETNYPQMPVVSALPGTTASPIRIPFGNGKGELIDLPGLERTTLIDYVQESHRDSLIMKTRMTPEQVTLKGPWQSLLLGGFIRITPRTPDLVFLTYNFTPLEEHKTMTEKAIGVQTQTSELRVENISVPGTGDNIALAGTFKLKYDVTKIRAGPVTRRDAANIDVERLPYRVVALDILIEGCGWVEVVAQVRTRNLFKYKPRTKPERVPERAAIVKKKRGSQVDSNGILQSLDLSDPDEPQFEEAAPEPSQESENGQAEDEVLEMQWPEIDVYSPGGRFVGSRRPLNAWLLAQPKSTDKKKIRARPKRSLKGAKKREKAAKRAGLQIER